MKKKSKKLLFAGILLIVVFAVWTLLIQVVDVQPIGQKGTDIGFAAFNIWFHKLTGVHMTIYTITDWMGLIPIFVCMIFGGIGLYQLIKRRSLFKVDCDILFLGIYYVIVIFSYLIFEMIPINYRPILIEGFMEPSYPSSTTLLVLSVMPTLTFQLKHRMKNMTVCKMLSISTILFSSFMVVGRWICGVHWFTDIIGSIFLSTGLFFVYKGTVLSVCSRNN